jgi:hypothetical protein
MSRNCRHISVAVQPRPSSLGRSAPSLAVGRRKYCGSNLGGAHNAGAASLEHDRTMFVHPTGDLENRRWEVLTAVNHFGHRDTDGIVVDLFWNRRNLKDEFRVQVEDRREGTRFVLHPLTGREAIQAFYHPFAAARAVLNE